MPRGIGQCNIDSLVTFKRAVIENWNRSRLVGNISIGEAHRAYRRVIGAGRRVAGYQSGEYSSCTCSVRVTVIVALAPVSSTL
jgi:hypothetical protein